MKNSLTVKAPKKTMPIGNGLAVVEAANRSAQVPGDSQITKVQWWDNLKVTKYFARGSVLFAEGQRPRGVYLLREGRAKVSVASAEGKTFVLRLAEVGDLLGIHSIFMDRPSGATVETLDRCRVDFISRDEFVNLLERDKHAYLVVAQALSHKLNGVMAHARLLLLSESATEKLARLLVRWCDELGTSTPQGVRINCNLTHEDMAQMICASRETVTRVLGELKRKRIVSVVDSALFVRNLKELALLAHSKKNSGCVC